jgi:hypothetical protein
VGLEHSLACDGQKSEDANRRGTKDGTLRRSLKREFLPCDRFKMAKVRKDAQVAQGRI